MRVCFKVRDFPDPIVKEFDSLVYNQVINEARFYNYGNQDKDGSLYVSFEAINREYMHLADWCKDCESLGYKTLKRTVLETGFIDLTDSIINIKNSKGEIIDIVINNAKIDSKSISMRFIEEH